MLIGTSILLLFFLLAVPTFSLTYHLYFFHRETAIASRRSKSFWTTAKKR